MTELRYWLLSCVLLGTSSVVATTGIAQEAPRPVARDPSTTEAEALRRGRSARAAGRWAEAESAFESALEAADPARMTEARRDEILGEIGLCELEQRKYRDAAEHLSRSFMSLTKLPRSLGDRVISGHERALRHVGRLWLSVSPTDASVLLDGRPIGHADRVWELFVEPGKHTIRARMSGYGDAVATFELAAGTTTSSILTLSQAPTGQAPEAAALPREPTPRKGSSPAAVTKAAVAGSPPPWMAIRIAGGALAVGAGVAGGLLFREADAVGEGLAARAAERRAGNVNTGQCLREPAPPECAELADLRTHQATLTRAGWVSLGAGGVIGALTVASFFVVRSGPVNSGWVVAPMVASDRTGLLLQGSW